MKGNSIHERVKKLKEELKDSAFPSVVSLEHETAVIHGITKRELYIMEFSKAVIASGSLAAADSIIDYATRMADLLIESINSHK